MVDTDGRLGLESQALVFGPRADVVIRPNVGASLAGHVEWSAPGEVQHTLHLREADGSVSWTSVSEFDREFEFAGLDPNQTYTLELVDEGRALVGGYFVGDGVGGLGSAADAVALSPGAYVVLTPARRTSIGGWLTPPACIGWIDKRLELVLERRVDDAWQQVRTQVAEAGSTYEFIDLRPSQEYRIRLVDPTGHFVEGYLVRDGARFVVGTTGFEVFSGDCVGEIRLEAVPARHLQNIAPPIVNGQAVTGGVLTVSTGTWSVASVSASYSWERNGVRVAGYDSQPLPLRESDVGSSIVAVVHAEKPDHVSSDARSAPVMVARATMSSVRAPGVTGDPVVGKLLRADSGAWSVSPATVTYQWLRNGTPVAGATSASYRLQPADGGRWMSVRVVARRPGYLDAKARSSVTAAVRRATPSVKATVSRTSATTSDRVKVTVQVTVPGVSGISGTIKVRYGSQTTSVPLKSWVGGKVVVTLPRLGPGWYGVVASYHPAAPCPVAYAPRARRRQPFRSSPSDTRPRSRGCAPLREVRVGDCQRSRWTRRLGASGALDRPGTPLRVDPTRGPDTDVIVDDVTGEVYPQLPDCSPADDSIRTLRDDLPEHW